MVVPSKLISPANGIAADVKTPRSGSSRTSAGVAVELCAGLGGIGIGLRALGFEIRRAYDSWKEAVSVYNHNCADNVATECNLLSGEGWKAVQGDRKLISDLELLVAGPPCKGFSQLRNGYHDGRNGHNRVLAAMPDYIGLLRPRVFLIENVPDLIRHREGKTLEDLISKLRRPRTRLRYEVSYQVYDAALFGTPQARRRVLILGVRHNSGKECLPEPGPDLAPLLAAVRHGSKLPESMDTFLGALRDDENDQLISAAQALSDLPTLDAGASEQPRDYASSPRTTFQRWARIDAPEKLCDTRTPAVKAETISRLQHIPPGGCARYIPEEHLNGLSRRYDSAYRRLHPDAPATALSTKYDCVYHYEHDRSLSVREYARLQGLPDRITFPSHLVCRRNAYEMIGNSVPPLLVERVLRQVLEAGVDDLRA